MSRRGLPEFWIGCAVALACGVFGPSAGAAQSVGGVKIVEQEWDGGIQLAVRNANPGAVTLTVNVSGQNARPERSMPMVFTCPGEGTFPLVRLRPIREDEPYGWRARSDWQFGLSQVKPDKRHVYALPYAPGARFVVEQGYHGDFTHTGNNEYAVDFTMPVGTPIHAARGGIVDVVMDRFPEGGLDLALRESVNFVMIRHDDGTYGEYVHLQQGGVRVKLGQKVRTGELLAISGNSGYTRGPHLHFSVFRAINGTERETFRVRFRTADGTTVEPVQGESYSAGR